MSKHHMQWRFLQSTVNVIHNHFGINIAAWYYCDLSSCSPAVPVTDVLPVRIDSSVAEILHSREAGKVHLGLALSFGRVLRNRY